MSLAVLADHLAAKGRNGDTMLVHMAPDEVAGLHALALTHGQGMTINPETGLPEAFSLKSLLKSVLPVVAGIALGPAGFGIVNSALAAGAVVGGATALATGSLKQGLMAGIGAYGGFGFGQGLAGAAAASPTMASGAEAAFGAANPAIFDAGASGTMADVIGGAASGIPSSAVAPSMFDKFTSGIQALGSEAGREGFMQGVGGTSGLLKSGYAAMMPAMSEMEQKSSLPQLGMGYTPRVRPMAFDPYTGRLQQLDMFNPFNTGTPGAADGGLVALAEGGSTNTPGLTMADVRKMYQQGGGNLPQTGPMGTPGTVTGATAEARKYLFGQGPYPVNQTMPEGKPLFMPYLEAIKQRAPAGPTATPQQIQNNLSTVGAQTGIDPFGGKPPGQIMQPSGDEDIQRVNDNLRGGVGGGIADIYMPLSGMPMRSGLPESGESGGSLTGGFIPWITGRTDGITPPVVDMFPTNVPRDDFDEIQSHSLSKGIIPLITGGRTGGPAPVVDMFPSGGGGVDEDFIDYGAYLAHGGLTAFAGGGESHLGSYSDGGRLLRGPGDGVSDDIPAVIGGHQPARLADGEFVVPARIVSELGNGSTEAGARKLYSMMDRVQQARNKTVGDDRVAVNTNADRFLPA